MARVPRGGLVFFAPVDTVQSGAQNGEWHIPVGSPVMHVNALEKRGSSTLVRRHVPGERMEEPFTFTLTLFLATNGERKREQEEGGFSLFSKILKDCNPAREAEESMRND
jgi:hypothetical protein